MSFGRLALPPDRKSRLLTLPWQVIVPVAVFFVMTLAGISQSSIGIPEMREDVAQPEGLTLGEPRAIRSDEYLTATPIAIGVTATGDTEDLNPLTAPQEMLALLPSGPVTSVLFLDGTALRLGPVLPDQMLMSARGWLATLLLVLAAPAWFRALTGSRWIGYFAAALILFSPHNAWWSNTSASILGFAFAGAVALQRAALAASEGRRLHAVGWGAASAVLLVRTPLMYPPWALVLVPAVLVATVAWLLAQPNRRRASLTTIACVGAFSLVLLGAVVWENWASIEAARNTIYPGARVATGAPNSMQSLFGATNLDILTTVGGVVGGNQSEMSSGFTVALVVAVLLLARGMVARVPGHRWAVISTVFVLGCWLAWCTVDFGTIGARIPVVNLVPAGRAAQIMGHLAVILLALVLPGMAKRGTVAFSLLAAGTSAAVAGYAGSLLRLQNIPELQIRTIWIAAFALALVVFLITYRPRAPWGYVLGGALALSLMWNVNPVQFGLADLRESGVAQDMLAAGDEARAEGGVWASDAYNVDSLMMATGVPSLSGRQMSGPDVDEWSKLDPKRANEAMWNRGGSFIAFVWSEDDKVTIANPSPDSIHVTASPCEVARRITSLTTIVATRELDLDCLTPVSTFTWGGSPRWIYDVG